MPLLGAHMSISGGLHLAFERIREVGGEALQIFSKNERQWKAADIPAAAAQLFVDHWRKAGGIPVAIHDSYLINLAATDTTILEKSVAGFADELRRAELLGISYLITHPGSHLGLGVEAGLQRLVKNLDRAIEASRTSAVTVLIETTAGQGTNLGSSFEEIAFILGQSSRPGRLGVCFDTCHVFSAGYDLRDEEAYFNTFRTFDEIVGLQHLKFFHLNDSKKGLDCKVDRHEHIGEGCIGLDAFRLLLNDPRWREHPMVLETPKGKDLENDRKNLRVLRSLIQGNRQLPPKECDRNGKEMGSGS